MCRTLRRLYVYLFVKVKVINISPEGKIALSIKQLLPPPERPAREGGRGRTAGRRAGGPRQRPPGRQASPPGRRPPGLAAQAPARSDNLSFEDMMSRFKSQSESKLATWTTSRAAGRGGSASRGRRGGR